jgi:hypothetical protein
MDGVSIRSDASALVKKISNIDSVFFCVSLRLFAKNKDPFTSVVGSHSKKTWDGTGISTLDTGNCLGNGVLPQPRSLFRLDAQMVLPFPFFSRLVRQRGL